MISDSDSGLSKPYSFFHEPVDFSKPVQDAVVGVDVKVDEIIHG